MGRRSLVPLWFCAALLFTSCAVVNPLGSGCSPVSFPQAAGEIVVATSCSELFRFDGVRYAVWCQKVHPARVGEVLTSDEVENSSFNGTYGPLYAIDGVGKDEAIVVHVFRGIAEKGQPQDTRSCGGDQLALNIDHPTQPKSFFRELRSSPN